MSKSNATDKNNFFDLYSQGLALAEEIDDYISAWHRGTDESELPNFLGMNKEEYFTWVADSESLPLILCARRDKQPLLKLIKNQTLRPQTIAARGNSAALLKVQQWLEQRKCD